MNKNNILRRKSRISDIIRMKGKQKICVVTAYDYSSALLCDKAEIDIILVGDSAGMVVLGYKDTLSVTMQEMLIFCKAVAKGASRSLIVGDMPFGTYHADKKDAISNAVQFIKAGCDAVKIEGGKEISDTVKSLSDIGIPVMGHIGLKPQTSPLYEGYAVHGKTSETGLKIIEDAIALQKSGAFSIVLEMVTSEVSEIISETLSIPTIGIGSGSECDGQVLVYHDVLGLYDKIHPKFVKQYTDLSNIILKALVEYKEDIKSRKFPEEKHTSHLNEEELTELRKNFKYIDGKRNEG